MKKFLSAFLAAAMVVSLTACSGKAQTNSSPDTPETKGDKNITVQIGTNPETLDPALNSTADGNNMIITMFEPLLIIGEDGKVQAGQAESWNMSDDGLTWTFTLRDGLKWSDGSDLTAHDFEYSIKRMADPTLAAPYAESAIGMVKGFDEAKEGADSLAVKAIDDKTLEIVLTHPCTYFDKIVASGSLSPVKKDTVESNGDSWCVSPDTYVCNGPYKMKEWTVGQEIVCEKNPNYEGGWDKDRIVTDEITFLLMEDSTAAYTAYQTGQAQLVRSVPTEELDSLKSAKDGGDLYVDSIMGTYLVKFNMEKAPFDNPLVRKALSLAIDREYVANVVMQGTYLPAYNLCGPGLTDADGSQYIDNSTKGIIPENFEESKKLAQEALKEAGYPNGEGFPTITYTTNDSGFNKAFAEYLQSQFKDVLGITLNIEIVEWSAFNAQCRAGDFELSRVDWGLDYDDPTSLLEILETGNGNNNGKISIPAFDKALEDSRKATNPEDHYAALHKAEDIALNDYAIVPVSYDADFWLQSPELKGTWHSPYGYWYLQYAYID